MFITTLRNLCTLHQEKIFLEPAIKGNIVGCYAQTEIGHGSDIQNLLTTATFDQKTNSFIMHTPETKAAKWWIGDLGIYATHACVFAQLIINNKKHGVHAFIVPIRDPITHKPFPGIEVGDIGPKLGYNNKDNGYLIMTNYRISRMNLLRKYNKVSKTGEYKKRGD